MFKPPIKSPYIQRKKVETPEEISNRVADKKMADLIKSVNSALADFKDYIQTKFKDLEPKHGKDYILTEEDREEIASKIKVPVVEKVIERTETIVEQPVYKTEIVKETIKSSPIDEKKMFKKLLRKLPKPEFRDIGGREKVETDPLEMIDKIMALPEEKLKKLRLKTSQVDGLEQTIKAFRNQLARGYLHGGGAGAVSVFAETPNGVVDGVNVTYTLSRVPKSVLSLSVNGMVAHQVSDWNIAGQTITMTSPIDISLAGKPFTAVYIQ
jgi:hypothetical protein